MGAGVDLRRQTDALLREPLFRADGVDDRQPFTLRARLWFDALDEAGEVGAGGQAVIGLDADRDAGLEVGGAVFG